MKSRALETPHALIIGLEENYRGAALEQQLDEAGFSYRLSPGVNAAQNPSDFEGQVDQDTARILFKRELTWGEVGCALAHVNACKSISKSGAEWTIVFEDDARLAPAFRETVEGAIRHFPDCAPPTVILLNGMWSWCVVRAGESANIGAHHETQLWPMATMGLSAAGYLINRNAAQIFVEHGSPIQYVADWPPNVAYDIDFFLVDPFPVSIGKEVASNLEGDRGQTSLTGRRWPRLLAAITGVRYLQHHSAYNSWRVYWRHEVIRPIIWRVARRQRIRTSDNEEAPLVFTWRHRRLTGSERW